MYLEHAREQGRTLSDQPQILQWLFSVATEAGELLVGGITDSLKACFEDVLGFPLVVFFNVNSLVLGFLN